MLFRNWRRKKIMMMLPKSPGTIRGSNVSTQPMLAKMVNCGIISVGKGIIRPDSSPRNRTFLNGIRILANANAASAEVSEPMIVTEQATIRLFWMPVRSGPAVQIRA